MNFVDKIIPEMTLHDKVDLGVAQDSKEDKDQRCFVVDATPLNKSFAKL